MPELPDVEIFKKYVESTALHKNVVKVEDCNKDLLAGGTCADLDRELQGKSLNECYRYGKYLFIRTGKDKFLMLHFGMTGFLRYYKEAAESPDHIRLLLKLENDYHLAYDCSRKLGKISLTPSIEQFVQDHELGPDALELCRDSEAFAAKIYSSRGTIKGMLMNQKNVAGLGNVYVDEILFQAEIHPKTNCSDLTAKQRKRIATVTRHVLQTAIEKQAGANGWPRSWLLPKRQHRQKCPRCGGRIERLTVSGRNGYYCKDHQRKKG